MNWLPDLASLSVYGVPLAFVIALVIEFLRSRVMLSEAVLNYIRAGLVTAAYLLTINLPAVEELIPSLPVWLPQVLAAIAIFLTVSGVQLVGNTRRFVSWVKTTIAS
jgi:hypothetical protein